MGARRTDKPNTRDAPSAQAETGIERERAPAALVGPALETTTVRLHERRPASASCSGLKCRRLLFDM